MGGVWQQAQDGLEEAVLKSNSLGPGGSKKPRADNTGEEES